MVASSSQSAVVTALPRERRYLIGAQATATTLVPSKTAPVARWPIGTHVPYQSGSRHFQVENVLVGGMGVVYVVTDVQSGEPFVVKTIKEPLSHRAALKARFQREVEVWIGLQKHPHIVQALGFEYLDDQPHIFLEYVSGGSLRTLFYHSELPVPKILRLAVEICRGMRHASAMGVTAHRDLKPDNILLTANQTAKVTDFGLVKMWAEHVFPDSNDGWLPGSDPAAGPGLTRPDQPAFGTKEYMSPEQWSSPFHVDIRSDVYSFGVMCYEVLTGIRPFYGKDAQELRERHFNYHPVPPSELRPDIPPSVDQVIARCLKKSPEERYEGFESLEQDLTRILQHEYRQVVPLLGQEQLTLEELNERGAALFNLGKYPQALDTFHKVIKAAPHHAVAWANRGVTLAEMAHFDQALVSFDEALRVDPNNAIVLTNKGMTLAELSRPTEALACFDRATRLDRFLQPAWRHRSETLNQLGRYESAYYSALKARQLESRDPSAHCQEAVALICMGRTAPALEALERFEALVGRQVPRSMLLRAQIAYQERRLEDACRLCASIDRDVPEYPSALLLGMQSALELGYLDEVEILLEDVQTPALCQTVLVLMKAGLEQQAKPSLRYLALACETAARADDFVAARGWYETWLEAVKASGQSLAEVQHPRLRVADLTVLAGRDGRTRIAQGALLLYLNEPGRAIPCLRSGLEVLDGDADGWRLLGTACNRVGDYPGAVQAFERLTRLTGRDASAWCDYAEAALRTGLYEEARAAAQQAQRLQATPLALFLHGAALFGLARWKEALKLFDQALEADEGLAVLWWNKGLCARQMGRKSTANRCLHRARALDIRFWRLSPHAEKPVLPYPLVSDYVPPPVS